MGGGGFNCPAARERERHLPQALNWRGARTLPRQFKGEEGKRALPNKKWEGGRSNSLAAVKKRKRRKGGTSPYLLAAT